MVSDRTQLGMGRDEMRDRARPAASEKLISYC